MKYFFELIYVWIVICVYGISSAYWDCDVDGLKQYCPKHRLRSRHICCTCV